MKKEWGIIDILRYTRHDTLNQIQLMKGNMALGKWDRVEKNVNEWIEKLKKDALISQLDGEKFPSLLLTYNWESHSVFLEYEIIGNGKVLKIDDEILTNWFVSFLQCLNESVSREKENMLLLTIHLLEEPYLYIHFQGGLINPSFLTSLLQKTKNPFYITNLCNNDNEFSFELLWKTDDDR